MSEVLRRLHALRVTAWPELRPAIDHAIALALEAEYSAARSSDLAMTYVQPTYPPLVQMLADGLPKSGAES